MTTCQQMKKWNFSKYTSNHYSHFGYETIDLNDDELKLLKQIEGNLVRKLIGIPK